jgi:hypothetical protein
MAMRPLAGDRQTFEATAPQRLRGGLVLRLIQRGG